MKKITKQFLAIFAVVATSMTANAQQDADQRQEADQQQDAQSEMVGSEEPQEPIAAGEILAPSPGLADQDRKGYLQVGVGPGFAVGLDSDSLMYNIIASYNRRISPQWVGKIIGDVYLTSGSDSARILNFAIAGDYHFVDASLGQALPYVGTGVGFANARNDNDETETAPSILVDGGVKFVAADLNWDLNATYTLVTNEIDGSLPSVFGVRAAINF